MNLINRIIAASAIVVAVFTPLAHAQQMRGGGGGFGGGGEFGGGGGRGGPYGGGGGGGGRNSTVAFISTVCDGVTPTTCELPPRRGGGGGSSNATVTPTSGIFVCRTHTNPNNLEVNTFSTCIPEDKGIVGDECGCCDDVCPEPCECPCDLLDRDGNPKVDANGDAIVGALVTIEGMDDDKCVSASASAYMVERSNGAVTCAACE